MFSSSQRGSKKEESKLLEHLYSKGDQAVSLICEEIKLQGILAFGEGVVRFDGCLEGKVTGKGTLIVGEKGYIEGEMEVGNLLLCGRVNGKVQVADLTHITPTGKLLGKVRSWRLIVDEGAILQGESEPLAKADAR